MLLLRATENSLTALLIDPRSGHPLARSRAREAREPLSAIAAALSRAKVSPSRLGGVVAAFGDAPFSVVRAAAVAGNAFSFALGIPALGFAARESEAADIKEGARLIERAPRGSVIRARYSAEPNITKPK
ncbi:MAG: hypothetical protein AAB562_00170 [Patescibacteria group bacterium]